MPQVARQNDPVTGTDIHLVLVPGGGAVPTPHPFSGRLVGGLSTDVLVNGLPAATVASTAQNIPPHVPIGGAGFQVPPRNRGTVLAGSTTVMVNGRALARAGDPVATCNDPVDAPTSQIVSGSVDVICS